MSEEDSNLPVLLTKALLSPLSPSFDHLRMAVGNLKKQASKKNEGSLACVKGGLSTFFEAQDALSGMHVPAHV